MANEKINQFLHFREQDKQRMKYLRKQQIENANLISEKSINGGITAETLIADGIISKANDGIVVIATGKLEKKLTVKAVRFTKGAQEKIEALGGKTEVI